VSALIAVSQQKAPATVGGRYTEMGMVCSFLEEEFAGALGGFYYSFD
jgi:hypothetical protein